MMLGMQNKNKGIQQCIIHNAFSIHDAFFYFTPGVAHLKIQRIQVPHSRPQSHMFVPGHFPIYQLIHSFI